MCYFPVAVLVDLSNWGDFVELFELYAPLNVKADGVDLEQLWKLKVYFATSVAVFVAGCAVPPPPAQQAPAGRGPGRSGAAFRGVWYGAALRVLLGLVYSFAVASFNPVTALPYLEKKWSQILLTAMVLFLSPNLDLPLWATADRPPAGTSNPKEGRLAVGRSDKSWGEAGAAWQPEGGAELLGRQDEGLESGRESASAAGSAAGGESGLGGSADGASSVGQPKAWPRDGEADRKQIDQDDQCDPPFPEWPLLVLKLMVFLPYLNAGIQKVNHGDGGWFTGESISAALTHHWLLYEFSLGAWIARRPFCCFLFGVSTMVFELLGWLLVFFPSMDLATGAIVVAFHSGIYLTMRVNYVEYWCISALLFVIPSAVQRLAKQPLKREPEREPKHEPEREAEKEFQRPVAQKCCRSALFRLRQLGVLTLLVCNFIHPEDHSLEAAVRRVVGSYAIASATFGSHQRLQLKKTLGDDTYNLFQKVDLFPRYYSSNSLYPEKIVRLLATFDCIYYLNIHKSLKARAHGLPHCQRLPPLIFERCNTFCV
mmetsp:Transcript_60987/g.137921  ORF Transcript_60987/g.137921 Transcript_60987/m.137921 type:complete len:541 (+) Transcript_60987:1107-2729(+)